MNFNDVVIVQATRTPIGTYKGVLKDISADKLGSIAIKNLINKTSIEESDIFKIIIWLIKFGYIAFNGEIDEK